MATKARFITFEGGEGAGKSTQIRHLSDRLSKSSIPHIVTREPGGSPGAEEIRNLIVTGEPGRWDPMSETLLLYAARRAHLIETILPALRAGEWVLCDRFSDSTMAYQSMGRGLDAKIVRNLEAMVVGETAPDLTFVLKLPHDIGVQRAVKRGGKEDRFERFSGEFHQKLNQAFLDIAAKNPQRCEAVEASGSEQDIADRIWNIVVRRYPL
jgi:dTMP kinase